MTENERVKIVRKNQKMTMENFGGALGVTRTAISNIENGNRKVTDQMRKSICREFSVNEEWLRTGTGGEENMYIKATPYQRAYNRFGYIMENSSPSKKAALSMLLELLYTVPDDTWDSIMKEFNEIKKEG